LLNQFNIKPSFSSIESLKFVKFQYQEPDSMEYDPNFWSIENGTDITGFFQSTLYFSDFSDQVKKELTPLNHWIEASQEIITKIKKENSGHDLVSLHMRRGDNTDGTDENPLYVDMYGQNGGFSWDSTYGSYLSNAIDFFKNKKVKFIVFTGGSKWTDDNSTDLSWCRKHFTDDCFVFPPYSSTMLDFSLIMNCDHNIISHISSFGWWASYLNPNKNKTVIAPRNYHFENPNYDHRLG
ncbi:unnamed protein product, partial [marine sediment metagenome]